MQPAEVVEPGQPAEDDAEYYLMLQSAISKSYKQKLLEFRRTMTPELIDSVRASLPPEHLMQLDQILREVALLEEEESQPSVVADQSEDGPYALTPEEHVAWEVLQDESVPNDFLRCEQHSTVIE